MAKTPHIRPPRAGPDHEHLWEAILRNISDAVFLTDRRGSLLFVCPNAAKLFGYDEEELYGIGSISPLLGEPIVKLNRRGEGNSFENLRCELRDKRGRRRVALVTASQVEILGDSVLYVCHDITDLAESEEARRASEKRFRSFFDAVVDYCYLVSPDGLILDINRAAMAVLGVDDKADVIGAPLLTTVYPEPSRARAERLFARFLEDHRLEDEEITIRAADGSERAVLLNVQAVHSERGELLYSVSRQSDVTERRRTEAALRETEELFHRTFLEAPSLMSLSTVEEGRFVDVNHAFIQITGFEREEAVGATSTELGLVSEPDRRTLLEHLREREAASGLEFALCKKGGDPLFCSVSARIIEVGGSRRLLTSAIDITDHKRAEQKLEESGQALRNVNLALEQKNAALQELMGQLQKEKAYLEMNVEANIDKLILPVLDQLEAQCSDAASPLFELLRSNLGRLTSSQSAKLAVRMQGLSRRELEVCNLVSAGKTSKEIAKLLSLSHHTVENHRIRIRKKLGVEKSPLSLVHFLQTR